MATGRVSKKKETFAFIKCDDGAPDWMSTHPSTQDRIATIEAALKAQPCTECKPVGMDWAAVRESLYADDLMRRPAKKK